MTTHFSDLAQRVAADGQVTADEVLALRREGWGDGIITREEAEALFAINNVIENPSDEWCEFFFEAIGEFVLNGSEPRRQCNDEEAQWLIAQIEKDGVLESYVELEALVRIVERAENVPDRLKNYLLEQIEREVMTGTGPTRCGGELSATHISEAEVRILRRVIFSSGGYGPAAVSRFDAELLFRLKDATLEDQNAEGWADLFVDGIANFIRGFVMRHAQMDRAKKLELQSFIANNEETSAKRFLSGLAIRSSDAKTGLRAMTGVMLGLRIKGGEVSEYAGEKIAAAAQEGAEYTQQEKAWLEEMVAADGQVDELERRVIKRIIEEGE